MNLNVGRLATESARRLMNEHAGVREAETHARGAAGEQDGRHRSGNAHTDGADARLDVLHGVVDGEAGIHRTAGGVDVQPDVLLGILTGQEEQLRHDDVGDLVVDGRPDEDDSVFEQPRVDVHPAFAPIRGLDDVRDQIVRIHSVFHYRRPQSRCRNPKTARPSMRRPKAASTASSVHTERPWPKRVSRRVSRTRVGTPEAVSTTLRIASMP